MSQPSPERIVAAAAAAAPQDAHAQTFAPTEWAGVTRRLLGVVRRESASGRESPVVQVALLDLAPGAAWRPPEEGGFEAFVLSGGAVVGGVEHAAGSYLRQPAQAAGEASAISSTSGSRLLVRSGPGLSVHALLAVPTAREPWRKGQGNLRVMPLFSQDQEGTALVHWPAGERFQPHRHWGGEEIFVLSGTFQDEHGQYPAGTWILSGHKSVHHPFVDEETVILVKTGHLLQAPDRPAPELPSARPTPRA
ncbi:MAG: cupin domain-containing protein [Planctomycetota bacterium]